MPHLKKLTPFFAFLIFGSIAVLLWQNQNRYERELVLRHTETSSEQIRIRIEGLMNARMASLESLSERWVERVPPDFSQDRFLDFAEMFYSHYPGFMGINWIDPTGVVRWVFPKNSNERVIDTPIFEPQDYRLQKNFHILHTSQNIVTPCMELVQGGLGYNTFLPLVYSGKIQGYLNGVFQVKRIVDICLAKDIFKDFWVRLYEADQLIYTNENQSDGNPGKNGFRVLRKVQFPGKNWKLALVPKPIVYPSGTAWKVSVLIFGIVISATLSLLLHLLLERMQMYRQARDQALQEVSERKRTEKALIENEKKLEATLAELADKNTELETFVYTVSHDLKTPIVTIEGFIGALREDFGDLIDENAEKYLNYMSDASRKMEVLINDLLYLSRIGRLPERKGEFSFDDLMKKVLKTLQPHIDESGVTLNVEKGLPLIYGEIERLGQVIENLLSNAVKYMGKENPAPRIDVGVMEQGGQKVFFVRDNGIGIEKHYYSKIFEIFQRLPSGKKIGGGTGVGLTIVKRIIEHHGGIIWLESEPGKGTTFYFTLKDKET
ncbi:MAG: ATP-binding protein [Desulfobacteraceae bacterium]|nr:ATP-binding protein [Desulfobacteraceae bacterium]MDH3874074.1 ATP-binding protein [Desulfobacteraceae bacterium]